MSLGLLSGAALGQEQITRTRVSGGFGQNAGAGSLQSYRVAVRPAVPVVSARAVRPRGLPPGSGGSSVTVNSVGFGGVTIGGQPATMTLNFSATRGTVSIAGAVNQDFSVTSTQCSGMCSIPVRFTPRFPGLRYDAVTATDSTGMVVAETFVYGTGIGPEFGYDLGGVTNYGGFIGSPGGVALGPDRRGYITDSSANAVYRFDRYTPDGFNFTQLSIAGLGVPAGVAVDGSNTVYVLDQTNDVVVTYAETMVNGSLVTAQGRFPTSPLSSPTGIAVDGAGTLYITDSGNGRVIRVDQQGNETLLADQVDGPTGVAVDSAGDVFYVDFGNNGEITELPAGGGAAISIATNLGSPQGIALDPAGRIYFTTPHGYGLISGSSQQLPDPNGTEEQDGVAVGPNGDVYLTQRTAGTFTITDRSSSNFILSTTVGGTTHGSLTISNTGNSALTLSQFSVTGTAFTIDSSSGCTVGLALSPQATCDLSLGFSPVVPGPDTETLTATSNSLNVAGSTNPFTLYGQAGPTTTTLAASANSISVGQADTFTAQVSDDIGRTLPTGTVTFLDGSTMFGTATLSRSPNDPTTGQATFTTSTLSGGRHSITAVYGGSTTLATSTSAAQAVSVAAGDRGTSTSVAVSPATVSAGAPETLTATIQGGVSPAVTGTVTFYDQNGALGSGAVMSTGTGGTATLTITYLSVGSHQVYGLYNGDGAYAPSTSGTQTVTVTAAPVVTSTSLTVDRATVVYRTPVALAATVLNADGGRVTTGQVIFCDAAAARCTPELSLGTAQLNGSGIAIVRLPVGIAGGHGFRAVFLGTSGLQRSVSSTTTVTVTMPSTYPTFTAIASSGVAGSYVLTGTVTGLLTRVISPGGTVSFNDTTSGTTLGQGTLGASVLGFRAVSPAGSPNGVGAGAYGVATGDFNGDGYPDVAVENYLGNTVSVLLGMGNGEFQPKVDYAVGSLPERVVVADLNGDGFADLLVANTGSNTVSVLLGRGDGTFRRQVTYAAASPVGLGVMDVNHDGFADVVAGDYYSNTVSVLLGRGDGTLAAAVTYATGSTPQTLAEGDFNGDGNVDLAVGNFGGGTVGILLGNGDGTFRTQVAYPVGLQPQGVQVGDFNGDGFDDLAVTNSGSNTVSVLLGNGDGTFRGQVTYPVGANPVGLVVADFNGDGFQDLSVGNTAQTALTQSVLLGNGDGTFRAQTAYRTGNFPYGEAVADFNGDGFPDLAVANFNDGTATILLSQVTQTATASFNASGLAPGSYSVVASYGGDAAYAASASAALSLVVPLLTQTITFPMIANRTMGDAGFALNATASSGLAVTYAVVSGPATVAGNVVTVTGAGTVVIRASQAGNGTYAAATAVTQSFAVAALPVVTLLAASPANGVVGAGATTVTLTGTNFTARDIVQLNGAAIASTFVSGTTFTAVVPASFLQAAGTGLITVFDPLSNGVSTAVPFVVLARPAFVFSVPSSSSSGSQPLLTLQLVNPYPVPITGTLTLTFAPAGAAGVDDPAVQFSTGGRALTFTIPPNTTITPSVQLQTGTVAGTATVTLGLVAGGVNVTPANTAPVVITIATAAPSVTVASVTRSGNSLTVTTHGFSNTREIVSAIFHFTPVLGGTINNQDVTVNAAAVFGQWYGSTASGQYGSTFTYTQQFTLSQDASVVGSVTVTLVNSVGSSMGVSAQ